MRDEGMNETTIETSPEKMLRRYLSRDGHVSGTVYLGALSSLVEERDRLRRTLERVQELCGHAEYNRAVSAIAREAREALAPNRAEMRDEG
jgi:hypothetical protein